MRKRTPVQEAEGWGMATTRAVVATGQRNLANRSYARMHAVKIFIPRNYTNLIRSCFVWFRRNGELNIQVGYVLDCVLSANCNTYIFS